MLANDGAGIAAPANRRQSAAGDFGGPDTAPQSPLSGYRPVPFTVLLNPQLAPLSDEQEDGWEGCLSVPGLRGVVARYSRLRYQGVDQYGQPIDRRVGGFMPGGTA